MTSTIKINNRFNKMMYEKLGVFVEIGVKIIHEFIDCIGDMYINSWIIVCLFIQNSQYGL